MWMFLIIYLGTIHTLCSSDINLMYQYDSSGEEDHSQYKQIGESREETTLLPTESITSTKITTPTPQRRYWLVTAVTNESPPQEVHSDNNEDEKDANLKSKIMTLVEQAIHDTERKLRTIQRLKEKHKDEAEYKVGFILSLVKKTRDVLNELFNIAVKHRDDYKALEQLKIFEFIVHTNVDTTNLVRQMVEIHIQNMNSTNKIHQRNRVVLL